MDTPNGILLRSSFRLLNAKTLGLTITLDDITEEEFRVMEMIDAEQKEHIAAEDRDARSFQELLIRKLSRHVNGIFLVFWIVSTLKIVSGSGNLFIRLTIVLIRVTSGPCIMQIDEVAPGNIRSPARSPWISAIWRVLGKSALESIRHSVLRKGFFDSDPRDFPSRVKRQIVTEYFEGYYMRVMARNGKTAGYVDLFAGPGIYGSGEESIPIVICKQVASDPRLRTCVKLWFNEGDPINYEKLKANIAAVSGIGSLTHVPRITSHVISESFAARLSGMRTPSFVFADPCGYKGLSLRLITSALKPFGNDCIFFPKLQPHQHEDQLRESRTRSINAFFETARADQVRGGYPLNRDSAGSRARYFWPRLPRH